MLFPGAAAPLAQFKNMGSYSPSLYLGEQLTSGPAVAWAKKPPTDHHKYIQETSLVLQVLRRDLLSM